METTLASLDPDDSASAERMYILAPALREHLCHHRRALAATHVRADIPQENGGTKRHASPTASWQPVLGDRLIHDDRSVRARAADKRELACSDPALTTAECHLKLLFVTQTRACQQECAGDVLVARLSSGRHSSRCLGLLALIRHLCSSAGAQTKLRPAQSE
eukprot:CAMPEP_0119374302 /NCGR_PEP_ID=MMETSP1334-20130426/30513_1 /TAXON_ID=127549 /ORGANISM="Calcidiscus leptoporus, Strain RCC1130" /LENGTH=161 /DNA_ID=CAMNT_0007392337 /DNA_START=166 /DNA_END=650 /DNA_ORIENTATION=+